MKLLLGIVGGQLLEETSIRILFEDAAVGNRPLQCPSLLAVGELVQ